MGSESRQRTLGVFVRTDEGEHQLLVELAKRARCTPAELIRAIVFDREPAKLPVPCSPRHEGRCTPHHRSLVDGYRDQRQREELELENETGGYAGDLARWRENGGTLVTFVEYLRQRGA